MENKFDKVIYTQSVFRTLLDCMSRPGKIGCIPPAKCGLNLSINDYTLGVAITLLDQEVTFYICGDRDKASPQLQLYTMSRKSSIKECDYLIVEGNKFFDINEMKKGTFTFPDESATVICQVQLLSKIPKPGAIELHLTGPGVKDMQNIYINGLIEQVINPWKQCNREYPLGIDWIFVDHNGNVCCIPRSTRFSWEVL